MAVRIEILDHPATRSFQYDGRSITVHEQRAYAHLSSSRYPVEINVALEQGQSFKPGMYEVDEHSFVVDRYKNLSLTKFLKLVPVKP